MDKGISKTRMELANKHLELAVSKIDNVTMFRGIPAANFDKEHLLMLCTVLAEEWHKAKKMNDSLLDREFVGEMAAGFYKAKAHSFIQEALTVIEKRCSKPSIWRKIWNRI